MKKTYKPKSKNVYKLKEYLNKKNKTKEINNGKRNL